MGKWRGCACEELTSTLLCFTAGCALYQVRQPLWELEGSTANVSCSLRWQEELAGGFLLEGDIGGRLENLCRDECIENDTIKKKSIHITVELH